MMLVVVGDGDGCTKKRKIIHSKLLFFQRVFNGFLLKVYRHTHKHTHSHKEFAILYRLWLIYAMRVVFCYFCVQNWHSAHTQRWIIFTE